MNLSKSTHTAILLFAGLMSHHPIGCCHAQRAAVSIGSTTRQQVSGAGGNGNVDTAASSDYSDGTSSEEIIIDDQAEMDTGHLHSCEVGFEGIGMTLRSSSKKKEDKVILDGSIKGKALPGRMLAIMGPSGSGKSTIIHAIAGRIQENPKLELTGRRYVNRLPLSGNSQLPVAFIEQETNFFPHMTVRETLDFRVELHLGSRLGKSARDDVVAGLLDLLGLAGSENTIVGSNKVRGLSGGERKRLSIACEMISSPPVIILDEPTSGLDSYQATQVMSFLRKLADSGRTVIAVIHQPSQHVFAMFNDLLLVSEGRLMYYGETSKVRSHLANLGYACPQDVGTAEHVLDCISRANGGPEQRKESDERLNRLAENAAGLVESLSLSDEGAKDASQRRHKSLVFMGQNNARRSPAANIIRQFRLLLGRSLRETFRGKASLIIKVVQQVMLATIYGGIYKLKDNQASVMDRFGLLSLIAIGAMNMAIAPTVRAFPKEKAIVSREMASGMYRTLPYFVAKAVSEIPLVGFFNGIFSAIIYPLTGLQKGRFGKFLGLTTLHTLTSEAVGLLISAISPNSDVALALFPPLIVLNIIFDGRNISEENTPRILRWIPKVGLIRWGFEGLAINEFHGLTFDTKGPRRGPIVKTGAEALERFGMASRTVGEVVNAQKNIVSVCWLLSYLALSLMRQRYQIMNGTDAAN